MNKILYIGDNRNRNNWGCRGTSIALSQILSSKFDISYVISGEYISDQIWIEETPFENTFDFFQRVSNKLSISNSLSNSFIKAKRKFSRSYGLGFDFIVECPENSVKNLIEYKHKNQKLEFIYESVKSCDVVVINGEGDMIFTTPTRRKLLFLLMVIELADYLDKPVFYVNAMVSNDPEGKRNEETVNASIRCLEKCQLVALRDPESLEIVNSFKANINSQLVPDALFTWQHYFNQNNLPNNGDFIIPFPEADEYFGKFDFSQPYICIGGGSGAIRDKEKAAIEYVKLVEKIKKLGLKVYLVENCQGDTFLRKVAAVTDTAIVPVHVPILLGGAVLANARLFISGRYHPSIFASLGGTPCIFFDSNSHKTRSLQRVLVYENTEVFSPFPTVEECENIFYLAKEILGDGDTRRNSIKKIAKKRAEESRRIINFISIN